jgi:hypothetical protein
MWASSANHQTKPVHSYSAERFALTTFRGVVGNEANQGGRTRTRSGLP